MKYFKLFTLFASIIVLNFGCGKSDLEVATERIRMQSESLKVKIDSTKKVIEAEKKTLDSLAYRIKKDSIEIDSLTKKMNPLKK